MVRHIPNPEGISNAHTLPAAWYADATHFERELEAVSRNEWVCCGVLDDMPPPRAWSARTVGATPLLFVRDEGGTLRAFLNVCRHRAAPLCDDFDASAGPLIRCPYHAWLYRLDGSLARASGMGQPEQFDRADHALTSVAIQVWRRFVFVHLGADVSRFDLGPLAAAIDSFALETLELVVVERDERGFNWKVLLENYSENYHTPFVHPEIDTSATHDYPMVSSGPVLYAWDRPVRADDDQPAQRIMRDLVPGEPGWHQLANASTTAAYDVGSYVTIWPNLMINVFPDAMLVMWTEPLSARRTLVERRLYLRGDVDATARQRIIDAHRLVHRQDVDICERVQRSHNAGLDANGRLSTTEEHGVHFVHQHLRAALERAAE